MDKVKDSKSMLLQCVGNTCKLINVGKCPNAQPINNPAMELPVNYNKQGLPMIEMMMIDTIQDLDDEG